MPSSVRHQSPAVAAPEEETPKTPLQVLHKERREARGLSAQAMSRTAGLNDNKSSPQAHDFSHWER